jgi:anti-anti-sigma factor
MADDNLRMQRRVGEFQIFESGPRTVVGFTGEQPADWLEADACRQQLLDLIDECGCESLIFDLTGVDYLSSGWLALVVAPTQKGVSVTLYDVSPHLRAVLRRTRLDGLVTISQHRLAP